MATGVFSSLVLFGSNKGTSFTDVSPLVLHTSMAFAAGFLMAISWDRLMRGTIKRRVQKKTLSDHFEPIEHNQHATQVRSQLQVSHWQYSWWSTVARGHVPQFHPISPCPGQNDQLEVRAEVFNLIDTDKSESISMSELVCGVSLLKGPASSLDLAILKERQDHLQSLVETMQSNSESIRFHCFMGHFYSAI